jgi:hypothetical protein
LTRAGSETHGAPQHPEKEMTCRTRCFVLALLAGAALAADQQTASVGTQGMERKPITRGKHAGRQKATQEFLFHLGPRSYRIRYSAAVDSKQPGRAFPSEGYVGMPGPTSCNWYHGGFLFVRINGQDIGRARLHKGYVAETGRRAIADLIWDAPSAVVRIRFAGRPADDKLLCQITLEPKVQVRSLRIGLRCYPSFFTAWHNRDGNRVITTPAATLKQGQRVELPAAKHTYAVYTDTVFDPARGEGEGPCAMLLNPEGVESVKFNVGSYAVNTALICHPDARRIRLAFWEFPKQANADVLARFRRSADVWRRELGGFAFTPSAVKGFDPQTELAQLDRLLQPPEVKKRLGRRAAGYRQHIAALPEPAKTLTILQEAGLLDLVADYREFLWELKLAELLAR